MKRKSTWHKPAICIDLNELLQIAPRPTYAYWIGYAMAAVIIFGGVTHGL